MPLSHKQRTQENREGHREKIYYISGLQEWQLGDEPARWRLHIIRENEAISCRAQKGKTKDMFKREGCTPV